MEKIQTFITKNSLSIGFSFITLCFISYLANFNKELSILNSDWGSFGSYIGGITSPIIGIIGIVLTYSILNNQNKESHQTEFRYMFEVLFEATEDKINIIHFKKGRKDYKGNQAIRILNREFASMITFIKQNNPNKNIVDVAYEAFDTIHKDANGSFSPYCKNIHNCLKIIDNVCDSSHKKTYANLLRAQLSKDHMTFLLYNGIGSYDFSNFKKRLEKYTMFQDIENIPDISQDIKNLYNSKAYID